MRKFLAVMAFSLVIAPVATKADIIIVNKSKSHATTVVSGAPVRCSDGPLILRVGQPDVRATCPVEVRRPVVQNNTDVTIVFLAHERRGHYRQHGYDRRKD